MEYSFFNFFQYNPGQLKFRHYRFPQNNQNDALSDEMFWLKAVGEAAGQTGERGDTMSEY